MGDRSNKYGRDAYPFVARRICWPDPDATCLEGGCLYCNDNPFRTLATIERWISRCEKDQREGKVSHRGNGREVDVRQVYEDGKAKYFYNAETKAA